MDQKPLKLKIDEHLCSAGCSYAVLHADGNITRCFTDCATIATPNELLTGKKQLSKPLLCKLSQCCDPSGDQLFASIWDIDGLQEASCTSWKESEDPTHAVQDRFYTVVFVTDKCNFSCYYCCNFYPKTPDEPRPSKIELDWNTWCDYLEFLKRFKTVQLNINGGEPLTWRKLPEALEMIYGDPRIELGLNSNLSLLGAVEKLPASPEYHKWRVSATIHPSTKGFSLKRFMDSAICLKEKGWWVRAVVLTVPEHLEWWDENAEIVRNAGIDLWFKAVGGYPQESSFWAEVNRRNDNFWKTADYLLSIGWIRKEDTAFTKSRPSQLENEINHTFKAL